VVSAKLVGLHAFTSSCCSTINLARRFGVAGHSRPIFRVHLDTARRRQFVDEIMAGHAVGEEAVKGLHEGRLRFHELAGTSGQADQPRVLCFVQDLIGSAAPKSARHADGNTKQSQCFSFYISEWTRIGSDGCLSNSRKN
jgi:hypothetical protein